MLKGTNNNLFDEQVISCEWNKAWNTTTVSCRSKLRFDQCSLIFLAMALRQRGLFGAGIASQHEERLHRSR